MNLAFVDARRPIANRFWLSDIRFVFCVSMLITVGCSQTDIGSSFISDSTTPALGFSTRAADRAPLRREPIRPLVAPTGLSPSKIRLGHALFNDVRLSHDNTVSCATCHIVAEGGDDGRPTSLGIDGKVGDLNAPTVLNSSLFIAQFWDGRARDLTEQAPGPIHNPIEMDSDWQEVIGKLRTDVTFVQQFKRTYPQGLNPESIVDAIVAYEKALITLDAPFDRYLFGDDDAVSTEVLEGYKIFKSIGCISCHQGRAVGGNMFQQFGVMKNFREKFNNDGDFNNGRMNVTHRDVDLHRFKVPSLRNVQRTSPYFHNGSTATLEEAIEIMAEFQLGESLAKEDVDRIKAFLISLNGEIPEELK